MLRKLTKIFQKSLETLKGEFRPPDKDGIQMGSGLQNPEPTPKQKMEIPRATCKTIPR
jgi:hypothetical protein